MTRRIPLEVVAPAPTSTLYVSERKVYPREISGPFQTLRLAAVVWLLGMYYVAPWLSWNGRQAVLFDLPARKFYVFGLTLWPQDFPYLALLLIVAAMALPGAPAGRCRHPLVFATRCGLSDRRRPAQRDAGLARRWR